MLEYLENREIQLEKEVEEFVKNSNQTLAVYQGAIRELDLLIKKLSEEIDGIINE